MKKTALYALAALLIAGSAFAAGPQKPGEWQMTTQMEIPNMPIKMPAITVKVCLTEEDLKDPQKSVPNDPKSDCKVGQYNVDGDTVTWTIECPKSKTKGEGEITFTDENSYTGKMRMTVGDQEMSAKYTGKFLGACSKK
jgi:Protein of unknown function (DUF3617)